MTDNRPSLFKAMLAQLTLPVYRMRLIAAKRIALLISDDKQGYQGLFLNWLSGRKFESEVISGLTVIGLMKQDKLIDQVLVRQNIKKPSILSDIYLMHIYGSPTHFINWYEQNSGAPRADFVETEDFKKISIRYTAPIFRKELETWQKRTRLPLLTQWAWEYEKLKSLVSDYADSPDYFYESMDRWEYTGSYHLRLADVLQSAYLRTLGYAVNNWHLDLSIAAMLSLNCISLDFRLAQVNPVKKPAQIQNAIPEDASQLLDTKALTNNLSAIEIQPGEIIVAASFSVCRTKNFSADYSIQSILSDGTDINIEKVFSKVSAFLPREHMPHEWYKQDYFLDFLKTPDPKDGILHAAFRLMPECFPRWQAEIIMCGLYIPSPILLGGHPDVEYNENCILFKIADEVVARWIYWCDNWQACHLRELNEGLGSALLVKKETINSALKDTPYQLKTAGHIKCLTREKDYGSFEIKDNYSDLISSI